MKKQKNVWLRDAIIALATALALMPAIQRPALAGAPGEPAPAEVMINGVEFIFIPEGWFYKTGGIPKPGSEPGYQDARGGGNVKLWLDGYYIAKFEARARDLVKYLNADAGKLDKYAGAAISCAVRRAESGEYYLLNPDADLPATHMSWEMADRWARWMGFRLLSEAEWEKAARGSDQRLYPWGDDYPDETYAGFNTWSDCFTWPVNSFKKGRSPYGVYNMAGNVREFIAEWFSPEHDASLRNGMRNPAPPPNGSVQEHPGNELAGPWKIVKGGRWGSKEDQLLIGARVYPRPDDPFRCNGTRFALDVATVRTHLAKGSATVIAP